MLVAITAFATSFASAQEGGNPYSSGGNWYWGGQVATVDTSLNSGGQDFSFTNLNLNFGYRYSAIFSVEGWASMNVSDERDEIVSSILDENINAEYNGVGIYGIAQSRGRFYVKGRLGLVESRFVYTASGYEDEDEGSIGFSYGVGGGIRNNNWSFELEYLVMPEVDDPIFSGESYDTSMMTLGFTYDLWLLKVGARRKMCNKMPDKKPPDKKPRPIPIVNPPVQTVFLPAR